MSRVAGLRLEHARLRFSTPVRFGTTTIPVRDVGLVWLTADDGLVGIGEAAEPFVARPAEEAVERLGAALLGAEIGDGDRLDEVLTAALRDAPAARGLRAAVEGAWLDVTGKVSGRSVAAVLGGGRSSVGVNGLLLAERGAAAAEEEASALVAAGYRTIKVKGATGGRDLGDALRAIRATVGPDVALRLDLNGALTEESAIERLRALDWAGLEYVEQPIPANLGPGALARLRRAVPMPIAVDEAVTDLDAAGDLLAAGACDVFVVKPGRVGGPRQAYRIAQVAARAGVGVTISTLYETGIGLAAALHVAATIDGDGAHGLGTGTLLEDDLIGGALPVAAGRMAIPAAPGLGVILDETALARFRVRTAPFEAHT